jgi:hypothetical protein
MSDESPRDDGGFQPMNGAELVDFPITRAKRRPIEPSVPGTNLREIGTAEGWEGIGINMLCAGMYYLLDKFGHERTLELIEHAYAESRKQHLAKQAAN